MPRITIRSESCKSCQYCVKFCPKECLKIGDAVNSKGYPYVHMDKPDACIGCAFCAAMCPDSVIEVYK